MLVHHLYQHSGIFQDGWLHYIGGVCQALGFTAVAFFFFLSGYGLLASYCKCPEMIRSFGMNKIMPFYSINVLLVGMYSCYRLFIGKTMSVDLVVRSLSFGGTVIANGWYIQVQLLYYIMFYFVFLCRNNKSWFVQMLFLHGVYVGGCLIAGLSSLYYERTFIFIFGMLWYENQSKIDSWAKKKKNEVIACAISCVLFVGNYMLSYLVAPIFFRGLSYFFLIPAVFLMIKNVNIQSNLFRFLGNISLEIYVMQGIFLDFFHSDIVAITNPYLYIVIVSCTTIVSAYLLHPTFQSVYRFYRKIKVV